MTLQAEKKVDRRIQRTQQLLRDALIELIVEKGYDDVSIQDITDRANVARTTFYLHYRDKEELLLNSMIEIYDDLDANMDKPPLPNGLLPDGTPAEIIIFQHVAENVALYHVLLVKPGFGVFINRAIDYLAEMFEEHINDCFPAHKIPVQSIKMVVYGEAGRLIGMVCWWLKNGLQPSAKEMAHLFYNSGHSGIWQTRGVEAPA
jgi:AcrR family transcriptional regulator